MRPNGTTFSRVTLSALLICGAAVLMAYKVGFDRGRVTEAIPGQPTLTVNAAEVFNLRSQCAKLGEDIKRANQVSPVLDQSETTHYEPRTNRCYVELFVQAGEPPAHWFTRRLFDGQTAEMLAIVELRPSQVKFAQIYMADWRKLANMMGWAELSHPSQDVPNPDFDFKTTAAFISKMMSDDRAR